MKNKNRTVLIFAIILILVSAVAAIYISTSPSSFEIPSFPIITKTTTTLPTEGAGQTQTATGTQAGAALPPEAFEFQPSTVTLEIKSWGYNPNRVTLLKGSTATWTNLDTVTHTATSTGNFDSGDIAAGKSWTYTFNKAGTFEYSCKYHPSMTATVVITE